MRPLVRKLAGKNFEKRRKDKDPVAKQEVMDLLTQQNLPVPPDFDALLDAPPPASQYDALLANLDAFQNQLSGPGSVQTVMKLGTEVFGINCPQ